MVNPIIKINKMSRPSNQNRKSLGEWINKEGLQNNSDSPTKSLTPTNLIKKKSLSRFIAGESVIRDDGTITRRRSMKVTSKHLPEITETKPINILAPSDPEEFNSWATFVRLITCCIPSIALKSCGRMESKIVQQVILI